MGNRSFCKTLCLAIGLFLSLSSQAFSGAVQVDFLLAGVQSAGSPLAGGKVYTYVAGTTTAKTCYADKERVTSLGAYITLDANGTSQAYCEGIYKFVIKDSSGTTIYTRDYLIFLSGEVTSVDVRDYGALCDDSTNDAVALQAALNGGFKQIKIPDGVCRYGTALTVPTAVMLVGNGINASYLTYTGTTGNGLVLASAADGNYITIRDLTLNAVSGSTGTGILAAGAFVLRDPFIERVYVDGFANGISLAWGINGVIRNSRVTGLGKTTASSTGIKFYSVGGHDTTTMTIDGVYVSDFETNHDIDGNTHVIRRSISSTSAYHYHSKGQVSLEDAWIEGVTTASDKILKTTAGLFSIRGFIKAYDTLGASVEQSSACFYDLDATGKESVFNQYERTHIRAYLNSAVQVITTATPTKVSFNAVSKDRHTEWDGATNFRHTAVRPGYYRISSTIYWATAALDHWVAIYKNGALFSRIIKGGVANDNTTTIVDTLYLDIGQYVEIWVSQASGGDQNVTNGEEKTWVTIDEIF